MNQIDKEQILAQVELKIGIIKTYYVDESGADELIRVYDDYKRDGTSVLEIKLFLDDLLLFIESAKQK